MGRELFDGFRARVGGAEQGAMTLLNDYPEVNETALASESYAN
jgi:hypothetical protein